MADNETKEVKLQDTTGDAGPAMLFIFTMLTIMFLGMYTGFFDATAALPLGLLMLACYPAYLFGGISYIQKGDTISGVCYLIFATCFGGIGGLSNLVSYYALVSGAVIDVSIFNLVWIWSGIAIIPIVAGMRKGPWIPFVVFVLGAIELILMGLVGFGWLPAEFIYVVYFCFVVVGFGGFYVSLANIFQVAGINAPLGRNMGKE